MSETLLFSIGSLVFAITVYGAVMAGGNLFGHLRAFEDDAGDDTGGEGPPDAILDD